jgi:hypothetical protein
MFYYLLIIYMNFKKLFSLFNDIRFLSVFLVLVFLVSTLVIFPFKNVVKPYVEGMTNEGVVTEEPPVSDVSGNFDVDTFNQEFIQATTDPINNEEETAATNEEETAATEEQVQAVCPPECEECKTNGDIQCLQHNPACVNCQLNAGDLKNLKTSEMGNVPNITIINQSREPNPPNPYSSLESWNMSKNKNLAMERPSGSDHNFGSTTIPSSTTTTPIVGSASEVTPQSSVPVNNNTQQEVNNL